MAKPSGPMTFETVRALALELPGTEEGTTYGSPAFKVDGKMFACIPVNKSAEADSLAVRVSLDDRQHLLTDAPDVYYVTDHYAAHPIVLVRLARIRRGALHDLLQMAQRLVSTQQARGPKRRRRRKG